MDNENTIANAGAGTIPSPDAALIAAQDYAASLIADASARQAETQQMQQQVEPQRPNYAELLKTDKELQMLLDKERTKAANTAREKERIRQQQLAQATLSRKEKEALMKPEELADMYKREADELRSQIARSEEIRSLTNEVNGILEECKIPSEIFNSGLDYYKMSAEEIRDRAMAFAKYVIIPKDEYEKVKQEEIEAGIKARLKEPTPENRFATPNGEKGRPLKPTVIF